MKQYFVYALFCAMAHSAALYAMDESEMLVRIREMHYHGNVINQVLDKHIHTKDKFPKDVHLSFYNATTALGIAHRQCWYAIAKAMNSKKVRDHEQCRALCVQHASVLNNIPVQSAVKERMAHDQKIACRELYNSALTLMVEFGAADQNQGNPHALALLLKLGAKTSVITQIEPTHTCMPREISRFSVVGDALDRNLDLYAPLLLSYTKWEDIAERTRFNHPIIYIRNNKSLLDPKKHLMIRSLARQHYFTDILSQQVWQESIIASYVSNAVFSEPTLIKYVKTFKKSIPDRLKTLEVLVNSPYYNRSAVLEAGKKLDQKGLCGSDAVRILNAALRKDHNDECEQRSKITNAIDQAMVETTSEPSRVAQTLSVLITDYCDDQPQLEQIPLIEAPEKPRKRCCNPGMMVYHALVTVGRISKLWKRD